MTHATAPDGFRQINRHDGLFRKYKHDAYKATCKPPEPTVCPECGAVFHAGRWQWIARPAKAHRSACPACQRIEDHYPAGFLTLQGVFFQSHCEEIMNLVHNHERRERAEHPLKRIMAVEDIDGATLVTTTDMQLARSMGETLLHAYKGELKYYYNPQEDQLRLSWIH
jgi:NMD protein affecting ribosome stability and mRNA decay